MDNLAAKTDRVTDALVGLTGIVGRLAEAQERTDARVRDLAEQARRTEANLGALIDMFERHLREDHGRPPS